MESFSLCHTSWVCNYHVVWIPKYRKKKIFVAIRQELGRILHKLAEQRESRILEGHLMFDHVHRLISIPPKLSVAQVIGYMKGKSAIHIARNFGVRKRNFKEPLIYSANKSAPFPKRQKPLWERLANSFI